MKTNKTLALLSALGVLAGGTALAQTGPGNDSTPSQPSQQPGGRQGWTRPNPEARHKALLDKYDANKDGKLDDTELAAIGRDVEQGKFEPRLMGRPRGAGFGPGPRARRSPRYGPGPRWQGAPGFRPGPLAQNGPGFGPGPRGPMGPAFRPGPRGPAFGPGPRGPRAMGGPGYGPRHREILQKYDVNKDGVLDDSERATMRRDIQDGKLERPGFGRGPRRLGPPPPIDGAQAPADQPEPSE